MRTKASDLRLADTLKLFDGAWSTGIVVQIDDKEVTVFRPYGTTADFSYSGGVIPYIGTETVKYSITSDAQFEVLERKPLK